MPEVIGHYHVLDRLGTGGIGELYRARDSRLGRTVAVRVVSSEIASHPDRCAHLLSAVRVAATLSHPNIAAVYEVGEDGGLPYLALEFVPGEPLTRLMDGHATNLRRAIGLAMQIADALAEAQAAGLHHGYLTPASITVTPKGRVKILDFGFAQFPDSARSTEPVPDLKSLGTVLCGLLPRQSAGRLAPTASVAIAPPERAEVDRIVRKLLAGDGAGGYESAATVAAELRAVAAMLDERPIAEHPPAVVPGRASRRLAPRWFVVLLVLLGVAAAVWTAGRLP
jgi:eukaryotic-like serine/threonine-protein kinase